MCPAGSPGSSRDVLTPGHAVPSCYASALLSFESWGQGRCTATAAAACPEMTISLLTQRDSREHSQGWEA